MTTASTHGRYPGRPLKNPLAAPSGPRNDRWHGDLDDFTAPPSPERLTDRESTRAEFEDYLRTTTNKFGRPYEEATIDAYVGPAKVLDEWMTAKGIEGDYTVADVALLNRFFRDYFREHGQGGTHTMQRNLIQLFNYLGRELNHPTPYASGLTTTGRACTWRWPRSTTPPTPESIARGPARRPVSGQDRTAVHGRQDHRRHGRHFAPVPGSP
jgi:hypothetical protein